MSKKWKALVCQLCPFCIAARRWPRSKFAKALAEAEKDCPFCQAYKELYGTGKPDDQAKE